MTHHPIHTPCSTRRASWAGWALAAAAALTGGHAWAAAFGFAGVADSGPLVGEHFAGSFAFDAATLTPGLDGELPLTQFSLQFGGQLYTLASADAPASASFIAGVLSGLSYVDIDTPSAAQALQVALVPGFFGLDDAYLAYETAQGQGGFGSYSVSVVPEPASLLLMLGGLAGLAGRRAMARRT